MKVKELREKANLSQSELAEKIGTEQYLISTYETGKRMPKFEMMKKLANFFGVGIDELFDEEEKNG